MLAVLGIEIDLAAAPRAAVPDPEVLTECTREGFAEVISAGAERSEK